MTAANVVSALSRTQAAQVAEIQALPNDQQREAAKSLLARTFNTSAAHAIRCIFGIQAHGQESTRRLY